MDPICSNIHVVCTGYVKSCWKATHGWNNGFWQVSLGAKEGRISNELWFHMRSRLARARTRPGICTGRPALALLSSDPKNDEWVRCQNLPVENPLHFLTWCSRGTKTKPSRRHGAYKSLFKIWILLWAFIQSFEKLLNLNFSFLHISHQHCLRKLTKISALSNCYVKNCPLYFIFWNKNHLEVWFYMNVPSKVDA